MASSGRNVDVPCRYLVTGGGGYLGRHLVLYLLQRLRQQHLWQGFVRVLDVKKDSPFPDGHPALQYMSGSAGDAEVVRKAVEGVDVVFHVASVISTVAPLSTLKVNVDGAKEIVKACMAPDSEVNALVFTSSTAAVFVGQPLEACDESLPYPDLGEYGDAYSLTKRMAEEFIRGADGGRGGCLRSVALRMAGIYGPDESTHCDRMLRTAEMGLFKFLIGDGTALTDWVYVDTAVQAHVKAADQLLREGRRPASEGVGARDINAGGPGAVGGKAYFITDNLPVECVEFFRPLVEGLGYAWPTLRVPAWFMLAFASLNEFLWRHLSGVVDFQRAPLFLSRLEVLKLVTHHHFRSDAATRDFGHVPAMVPPGEGLARAVESYRARYGTPIARGRTFLVPHLIWWLLIVAGMYLLYLCTFHKSWMLVRTPAYGWGGDVLEAAMGFPTTLVVIWWAAVCAHVAEAVVAYKVATSLGLRVSIPWFLQTLVLGYPSLGLLLQLSDWRRRHKAATMSDESKPPVSGKSVVNAVQNSGESGACASSSKAKKLK
eukprot:jgi/Mesvir1/1945/Mv22964-RA.1